MDVQRVSMVTVVGVRLPSIRTHVRPENIPRSCSALLNSPSALVATPTSLWTSLRSVLPEKTAIHLASPLTYLCWCPLFLLHTSRVPLFFFHQRATSLPRRFRLVVISLLFGSTRTHIFMCFWCCVPSSRALNCRPHSLKLQKLFKGFCIRCNRLSSMFSSSFVYPTL